MPHAPQKMNLSQHRYKFAFCISGYIESNNGATTLRKDVAEVLNQSLSVYSMKESIVQDEHSPAGAEGNGANDQSS